MIEQRIRRLETGMDKLAKAVADAAKAKQEADQIAQQEKVKAAMIEVQAKLYDKAAAYANLIMAGGYAGTFAIWSATRQQLPAKANILVALLVGISLASFVFFEIYKMTYTAVRFMRNRNLLVTPRSPEAFATGLQHLAKDEQKLPLLFIPIWISILTIAVVCALLGVALLFYNYIAALVGWPPWPVQGRTAVGWISAA